MLNTSRVASVCAAIAACILPGAVAVSSEQLPSYPLAVRSPYLSTWLPGPQARNVATAVPQFWQGQNLSWPVLARVNGTTYALLGVPDAVEGLSHATTNLVNYTSTHTYVTLRAGLAEIVLDFFSPVFPNKEHYANQSLPYSYLTVSATSSQPQSIQILSAIDQSWTAQNGSAQLNYTSLGSVGYFQFYNPDEIAFTEENEMATWGSVIYATTTGQNTSSTCDTISALFQDFSTSGSLNAKNTCAGTAFAALAQDLGVVDNTVAKATFAIGFERPQAINYVSAIQTGFHRTVWPTIPQAVSYFLGSYERAVAYSDRLDQLVRSRAEDVSKDFGIQYADILEASVRQTFGAFELTAPLNAVGAAATSNDQHEQTPFHATAITPSMFLKEISSDGNINTVDVLFQSWPIFITLNPEYIRLFWEPVLGYLQYGNWPHPWVIHDMGTHYPNATGHRDDHPEEMPLFETSSLFILLYAYQKYTNDTSYARQYSSLLQGYADYLVENSLYPATQLSSVDAIAATPNQTAIAVQAAIGLNAAGNLLGNSTLSKIGESYAHTIYDRALGLDGNTLNESKHFTYNYGAPQTWNVLFASYSDVILDLGTFPSAAWEMQSRWYEEVMEPAGLPYGATLPSPHQDSRESSHKRHPKSLSPLSKFVADENDANNITWGLTDWNIMVASISSDAVQTQVINSTWHFMTNGKNDIPFGTKYDVDGKDPGLWLANKARSTVGTHFALVALKDGTWNI